MASATCKYDGAVGQDELGNSTSDKKWREEALIWVPLIEFDLLDVLEFDNDRKRMSVIIRCVCVYHVLLCLPC